jgi:hydroxymethylbilane synthase
MNNVGTPIPLDVMLPAPTQAVIAIECRADDHVIAHVLTIIDDQTTQKLVLTERAFVAALGGTCHSPVAAYAEIVGGKIRFRAQIFSEDGRDQVSEDVTFECADCDTPKRLARTMLDRAPDSIRSIFAAG